jgi:uncharacterized membrane protein
MTDVSPTLQAEQRAQKHWVEDGLPSIIAGIGGLVLAFFILYRTNGHSPFKIIFLLGALTLYWAISQHQTEIVDWLKTRLSYPRTGYVRPPYMPEDKSLPLDFKMLSMEAANTALPEEIKLARARSIWLFLIALSFVLLPFVAIAYFHSSWIHSPWLYFALSLSFVAILWILALIEHRRPSWILVSGFFLVGLCMLVFQHQAIVGPDQFGYFLVGVSLVSIVNGAVSLFRFLRRNPRPASTTP